MDTPDDPPPPPLDVRWMHLGTPYLDLLVRPAPSLYPLSFTGIPPPLSADSLMTQTYLSFRVSLFPPQQRSTRPSQRPSRPRWKPAGSLSLKKTASRRAR